MDNFLAINLIEEINIMFFKIFIITRITFFVCVWRGRIGVIILQNHFKGNIYSRIFYA